MKKTPPKLDVEIKVRMSSQMKKELSARARRNQLTTADLMRMGATIVLQSKDLKLAN